MPKSSLEQRGAKETEQRLQKILQGAFSGPPTPLKDIPTRWGKQRAKRGDLQPPPPKRRKRKTRAA